MIDLTNPEIFAGIQQQATDVIINDDVRRALVFVRNMSVAMAADENKRLSNYPEQSTVYQGLTQLLSFICLPSLSDRDCVELFEQQLLAPLTNPDIDLVQKVRAKLITIPVFAERDVLRRRLRQSLLRNQQPIGSTTITVDGQPVPSTIGNWLRSYSAALGSRPASDVARNQFMIGNKDFNALTEIDRATVRNLISLYEFLKLSSVTPEGLEEPLLVRIGNELKVLQAGKFEDIKFSPKVQQAIQDVAQQMGLTMPSAQPAETASLDEVLTETPASANVGQPTPTAAESDTATVQAEVAAAYQGDPKERQAVIQQEEKLQKKIGTDQNKASAEFYSAVQTKDRVRTIAILRVLAGIGGIEELLKADKKLVPFLVALWEPRYGKDAMVAFTATPDAPRFVRLFLAYILQERLEMSESDAARIGVQLGNIFVNRGKKEYTTMAYFDVASKQFKWFEE